MKAYARLQRLVINISLVLLQCAVLQHSIDVILIDVACIQNPLPACLSVCGARKFLPKHQVQVPAQPANLFPVVPEDQDLPVFLQMIPAHFRQNIHGNTLTVWRKNHNRTSACIGKVWAENFSTVLLLQINDIAQGIFHRIEFTADGGLLIVAQQFLIPGLTQQTAAGDAGICSFCPVNSPALVI